MSKVVVNGKLYEVPLAIAESEGKLILRSNGVPLPLPEVGGDEAVVAFGDGNVYTVPLVGENLHSEDSAVSYVVMKKIDGMTEKQLDSFIKEL